MNEYIEDIPETRVGIIGTGFLATGLVDLLNYHRSLIPTAVLTRRNLNSIKDFPQIGIVTNEVDELIEKSDLIVECSGDVIHATEVISRAMDAGLPVVTMDAELHATTGSYFVDKGFITEAEGDQPGSLAALKEEVEQMGFRPLVYGNIKWFLNHTPTEEDMVYWSGRQGISLTQVTSFTDGTKLQIEQALVANGLGADIVQDGLTGLRVEDLSEGATRLAEVADGRPRPISDYVLAREAPPGVFIAATHRDEQASYLKYYKLGEGPYYIVTRPYHLCHIELPKTILRYLTGRGPLLNNSARPHASVAAIAKRTLMPGHVFEQGIGGFDVRGEAIEWRTDENHAPIGLMKNAVVKHKLEPGQRISLSDVDIPNSMALEYWLNIRQKVFDRIGQEGLHLGVA